MSGAGKPISIRGLAKIFTTEAGESVAALTPVTLDVAGGEFVAIVGPSGCGKTTLLNILAGLLKPTTGEARVSGELIAGPDIDRGMVFQSYALFPWRSVMGNVEFGLERKGLGRSERRAVALDYLASVGLQEFATKQIHELSGGMKQRVAIARAFAPDPSTILMDEPFGALDALTRRTLQRQLLGIWQEHKKTVVFVTHSVMEAILLADRVVVMTARPGAIKSIIRVELVHPRDPTSTEFRSIERAIFADLDAELAKSIAEEARVAV